jgi:hypothetical protein
MTGTVANVSGSAAKICFTISGSDDAMPSPFSARTRTVFPNFWSTAEE